MILDSVVDKHPIFPTTTTTARDPKEDERERKMQLVKQVKLFGGSVKQFAHESASTKCTMKFSVFLPPNASETSKVPVLFYLAGLTCSDELLFVKAPNAAKVAAARGIAVVTTDTRCVLSGGLLCLNDTNAFIMNGVTLLLLLRQSARREH